MKRTKKELQEVNAGSMADIAFLLLIFFLVTTTILHDKGLSILLPPERIDNVPSTPHPKRNVFKILVNSHHKLLVEDSPLSIDQLKEKTKEFITNYKKDPNLSDHPQKAIVSFKADRGTEYSMYIQILDEIKGAYHELRAEKMGITLEEYLNFDIKNTSLSLLKKYEAVKKEYPIRLSEAESNSIGMK